jgi:hypothetical protein
MARLVESNAVRLRKLKLRRILDLADVMHFSRYGHEALGETVNTQRMLSQVRRTPNAPASSVTSLVSILAPVVPLIRAMLGAEAIVCYCGATRMTAWALGCAGHLLILRFGPIGQLVCAVERSAGRD